MVVFDVGALDHFLSRAFSLWSVLFQIWWTVEIVHFTGVFAYSTCVAESNGSSLIFVRIKEFWSTPTLEHCDQLPSQVVCVAHASILVHAVSTSNTTSWSSNLNEKVQVGKELKEAWFAVCAARFNY
jgi:hypothetical protein